MELEDISAFGGMEVKHTKETEESNPGVMTRRSLLAGAAVTGVVLGINPNVLAMSSSRSASGPQDGSDPLQREFRSPPDASKAGVYWWWLDGAASKEGISADLESMKQQGISYALLFNAGEGGARAPKGPPFMSEEWRQHFRFAVQEAARLGIEMGVNVSDGWNCGGPWVTKDDAVKDFVWDETEIDGPGEIDKELRTPSTFLPVPDTQRRVPSEAPIDWYRDIAVLACREREHGVWQLEDIEDLTHFTREGRLRWKVPEGRWTVIRMGYVVRVTAGMDVDQGYHQLKNSTSPLPAWEIDPMSADAMDRHYSHTGAKLVEDAGALAGSTLKYFHIDSWEIGIPTWTEKFPEEFRIRRGYDPIRYLPALVGKKLGVDDVGSRFAWDFRRTIADLTAQNYYGRFRHLCQEHGVGTDCEAGGPFFTQFIDAMECQGVQDIPMGEFWSSREWPLDAVQGVPTPFFHSAEKTFPFMSYGSIKQMAGAAHIYGKKICQAESYTSTNDDWSEDPYFLKADGDRAFCLGLTRQILCFFVHQSTLTDKPGYEWEHVGTHFDRNVTWWPMSQGWLTYIARCQHLLRQGVFSADILYFSGQSVPNFVLLDRKPVSGYDFDVINAEGLLTRAGAQNGRVVLPDGVTYRYFVLPEGVADSITPAVLNKVSELVEGGVTLVGGRPKHSLGLTGYPHSELQIREQSDALWGTQWSEHGTRHVGAGRVIWGHSLEEVIRADGVKPDVEFRGVPDGVEVDWLHRHDTDQDIYFLANLTEQTMSIETIFRIHGKVPELWDPVTGEIRDLEAFRQEASRTVVPLLFAPKQSLFVLFRRTTKRSDGPQVSNFPALREIARLEGPWDVRFDAKWGGAEEATFQELIDWSRHPDEGIRYYSGKATYLKRFDLTVARHRRLVLDLGEVKNLAQVRLNGKDLGILWTVPWQVDVADVMRQKGNELEIDVVNLWPNRLIGDGLLPKDRRLTKTNVLTYDTPHPVGFADTEGERVYSNDPLKLLPSGLLGPVRFLGKV